MVLTYDAYSETLEKQQEKESEMQKLKEKQEQDMKLMREEMENKFQQILAKIDVATLKQLKPYTVQAYFISDHTQKCTTSSDESVLVDNLGHSHQQFMNALII